MSSKYRVVWRSHDSCWAVIELENLKTQHRAKFKNPVTHLFPTLSKLSKCRKEEYDWALLFSYLCEYAENTD